MFYRASLFAQSDILGYNPAPGDLSYPERLIMMKDIDASMHNGSDKKNSKSSAIDLHCLW